MFLKKYTANKIPWIYTRSTMLFVAFLELIIFISGVNYFFHNNISGLFVKLFLGFHFVFLSYIFGRYNYKVNQFKKIIQEILSYSLLVFIFFILSYLLIAKFDLISINIGILIFFLVYF